MFKHKEVKTNWSVSRGGGYIGTGKKMARHPGKAEPRRFWKI